MINSLVQLYREILNGIYMNAVFSTEVVMPIS